jgi:glutaryl-CoA dehydrogenase (non-decarboxylating)
MFFELSEEQRIIKDSVKRFAEERIAPVQEEDEKKGIFRREIVSEMGKLGFFGGVIPEESGGTNIGFLSSIIITEEISKVSASYGSHLISQTVGPGLTILKHGTKSQIERYLPGLISGDLMGCFASTEPDAGSDVASMKMTALKNEKGYILNGTKTWITNATVADVGLVFAYTEMEKKHKGISCFILDLKKTPGITTYPIEKLGLSCSVAGEITFEEVELPSESLLGNLGEGFQILMEMLANTRLFAAARALGVGGACLEASIKYAKAREQFGQSISKFQMIQDQIAEMYIEHEAAKLLVYQAALNKDKGRQDAIEVSVAKYFACEAGMKAADTALKIYGSYGFSMDYPIQRYIRDSRVFHITEGTANIQKVIISRGLLKGGGSG